MFQHKDPSWYTNFRDVRDLGAQGYEMTTTAHLSRGDLAMVEHAPCVALGWYIRDGKPCAHVHFLHTQQEKEVSHHDLRLPDLPMTLQQTRVTQTSRSCEVQMAGARPVEVPSDRVCSKSALLLAGMAAAAWGADLNSVWEDLKAVARHQLWIGSRPAYGARPSLAFLFATRTLKLAVDLADQARWNARSETLNLRYLERRAEIPIPTETPTRDGAPVDPDYTPDEPA